MIKFNKTKKYQSGGGIPVYQASPKTPVYQTPLQFMQEKSNTPANKIAAQSAKQLAELEGLPADVAMVEAMYQKGLDLLSNATELDYLSNSENVMEGTKLINQALSSTTKAKLKSNQKEYERISALVKDKASAYVTSGGRTLVTDGKKLDFVPASAITSKMRPVTVAELNNLRRNNLGFRDDLYKDIDTTYSLESINKFLNEQIKGMGTNEEKFATEGLLATAQIAQKQGLSGFKQFTKNNSTAVKALNSTWLYLNDNQKEQLRLTARKNYGVSSPQDVEEAAKAIMAQVFTKTLDTSTATAYETDDKLLGGSSGGTSGKMGDVTYAEWVLTKGKLEPITQLVGTTVGMDMLGSRFKMFSTTSTGTKGGAMMALDNSDENNLNKLIAPGEDFYTLKGTKIDPNAVVITPDDKGYVIAAKRDASGKYILAPEANNLFNERLQKQKKKLNRELRSDEVNEILSQVNRELNTNTELATMFTANVADVGINEEALDQLTGTEKQLLQTQVSRNLASVNEQWASSEIAEGGWLSRALNFLNSKEYNPDYYKINIITATPDITESRYFSEETLSAPLGQMTVESRTQQSSQIGGDDLTSQFGFDF